MSTKVTLSDKSQAISAVYTELKEIETLQLECGEQITLLLLKQVRLAEKSGALLRTIEKLAKSV